MWNKNIFIGQISDSDQFLVCRCYLRRKSDKNLKSIFELSILFLGTPARVPTVWIIKTGRVNIYSDEFWGILVLHLSKYSHNFQVLLNSSISKMFVAEYRMTNVSDLRYEEFSNLITMLTQVMAVGRISSAKLLISVLIVSKEGLFCKMKKSKQNNGW